MFNIFYMGLCVSRQIENLIKEDELRRAEEEKLKESEKAKQDQYKKQQEVGFTSHSKKKNYTLFVPCVRGVSGYIVVVCFTFLTCVSFQEDSKDFVTLDNLEEKIDELLSDETYFNYAITPDGEKIIFDETAG